MEKIYHHADFTIIASGSPNASYGLPGVRGTPRIPLSHAKFGGTTFAPFETLSSELSRSVWSTRGWTLQEDLLSRRRLVFGKSQVFFGCRRLTLSENTRDFLTIEEPGMKRRGPGYLNKLNNAISSHE
ncbi:hypothetical protein BDY21DRAFT_306310, partial [Lineolata rhizophorae]